MGIRTFFHGAKQIVIIFAKKFKMIPEGNTIEDIRARETIIRDFYREWKIKNPSQRKYNLSLKGMKKRHLSMPSFFAPECVWEVYAR